MNTADLLSDPIPPMQTDNRSGAAAAAAVAAAASAWNSRKTREEYDMYKSRLQDQRFNVGKWRVCPTTMPLPRTGKNRLAPSQGLMLHNQPTGIVLSCVFFF